MPVVLEDRVLVRVARLVLAVLGIHVLPEAVVHAVGPHLDHCEERPGLRLQEVLGQPEATVRHLVDLAEEVGLVVGAKSFVSKMYSPTTSAISSRSAAGVGVSALQRRGEEASHHDAVQRPRRCRHREDDRRAARAGHEIPEARLA